jgi:V/A-type H+-transporting ATPase subunit I
VTLRPVAARWFELLTSREQLGAALECLAESGSVQLQTHSRTESRLALPDLQRILADYETLARRYGHVWPAAAIRPLSVDHELLEAPQQALERLRAWAVEAEAPVAELQHIAHERSELDLLATLLRSADGRLPRLDRLATAGPMLTGRVYASPEGAPPQSLPPTVMTQWVETPEGRFLLALGPSEEIVELDSAMQAHKARVLALPRDLPLEQGAIEKHLAASRAALETRERTAQGLLQNLATAHRVEEALGELALASWLVANVPELPVTEHFAWVTGWFAAKDDAALRETLERRGIHYLLRFTEAPMGMKAPSVLRNPWWARPFEVFAGLMGVPGTREADPSIVVALLAPLMFGYMFGDVVQGLALVAAGLALRNRLPALRLLVPGGAVAVLFGFAFGSFFAREDVIPALWVAPLENPLLILGVALGFGVIAMTGGLLINALQFHWRGEMSHWFAREAGILVAYLGIAATAIDARALWALPVGVTWAIAGEALTSGPDRIGAAGKAAGEVLERMLQLSVNTVSFVRVGAFALAHCGLCVAVVGIAEASGPAYWVVLLIGNVAIVVIEGLVVGIQTTRLILFEFFIRFLTAGGRRFEPLPPPRPPGSQISRSHP